MSSPLLLAALLHTSLAFTLDILISDQTQQALINYFHSDQFFNFIQLTSLKVNLNIANQTQLQQSSVVPKIIVDASSNWNSLSKLKLSENPPAIIQLTSYHYFIQSQFFVHFPIIFETQSLRSLISYYQWERVLIISQSDSQSIQTSQLLQKQMVGTYSEILYITQDMSQNVLQNFLSKNSRPNGLFIFLVVAEGEIAAKIEKALMNKKLLQEGSSVVYSGKGCWAVTEIGSICMIESGLVQAQSQQQYTGYAIKEILQYVQLSGVKQHSEISFSDILIEIMPFHQKPLEFKILNKQQGGWIQAGIINQQEILMGNITFPGPTSEIPVIDTIIIPVSFNSGAENPDGTYVIDNTYTLWGTHLAIDHMNEDTSILQFYHIEPQDLSCGATQFDYEFAKACFTSNQTNLGVALVPSVSSGMSIGTNQLFQELEIDIPIIAGANDATELGDKETYPKYLRIVPGNDYNASANAKFLTILGIYQCAIIYGMEPWGDGYYKSFVLEAEYQGIQILNHEDLRGVNPNYNRSMEEQYSEHLDQLVNTGARYIFVMLITPYFYYWTDSLYYRGLRQGDVVILSLGVGDQGFQDSIGNYDTKRETMLVGTLGLYPSAWISNVGEQIFDQLTEKHSIQPILYACHFYDAGITLALGLDWIITNGEDYQEVNLLNNIVREMRFTGCTGTVYFDQDTNNRSNVGYDVSQAQKIDEVWTIVNVGVYNPVATIVLSLYTDMIWADGTTDIPPAIRQTNYECPFPDQEIEKSEAGFHVLVIISISVALISILVTILLYKKWWNLIYPKLTIRRRIQLADAILMFTIVIQSLQYAALGPRFNTIVNFLAVISDSFSLNFQGIYKYEKDIFWVIVYFVYCGCILWVFLGISIIIQLRFKFPTLNIVQKIHQMSNFLLPILGNMLFIPFVSTLLNIYVCVQGTGQQLTDSFLQKDCHVYCWQDKHLINSVIAGVCFISYTPIAIYCRPVWQEYQTALNIYTQPSFMMIKTLIQIILILMNLILYHIDQISHGFFFVFVLVFFALILTHWKPFNYEFASMCQMVSLLAVSWLALLATFDKSVETDWKWLWLFLLLTGWALILGVAGYLTLKKYPILLYKRKDRDISQLFKFQFSRKQPQEFGIKSNQLDYAHQFTLNDHSIRANSVSRVPRLKEITQYKRVLD